MMIESPAFVHEAQIPKKYTCEGEDISPPLIVKDLPKGAKSLAIIIDDPDAPMGTFVHWIAWNIKPTNKIEEGAEISHQGSNDFKQMRYRGPCPPPGKAHRYFFKLYVLDKELDLPQGATKQELLNKMEGHIIKQSSLIGTYQR